ncbi:MAG: class I SAM-dependent methyltransferase [Burkholderiaceae bacterium]
MTTDLMHPSHSAHSGFAPRADELDASRFPAAARLVTQMLRRMAHGALRLEFPDGQSALFGDGEAAPVRLAVFDWEVFGAAFKSGDIGFAEGFIDGHWQSDDLPGLLTLLVRNRAAIEPVIYGTWWGGLLHRLRHLLRGNSKRGSRRNIHAHYDIGNDFYQLWLDPSMTYSSALFSGTETGSLEQAQRAKYRRILDELALPPGARVLEIGCGWGGFAEVAARETNARVTGLTLSVEQLQFANRRLAQAGVVSQVELLLQDYRDADAGGFDAIASIEMFEAVGERYWPEYFACVARNLKPGGRACIQTITIDDALFDRYRLGTDFIQQYIFPGGMLPSPSAFRHAARQHGLEVIDEFAFGLDYARTLAAWRAAFVAQRPRVRAQGFDDRFLRTWEFYLAYCEAGFRAGSTDVMQFTLRKPD